MGLIPGLHTSPLRYPGGKGKIANYVKALMLENGLVGRDYVEPYAGGASVALALLFEDYADSIHINDLNPGVYAFWHAVLHETAELCDRIATVPLTMDEWHAQREVVTGPIQGSSFDLGFATFYLNRTNRSGIIRGGVIGGKAQIGEWKIDARFNRDELSQRIRKIRRHASRIHLTNEDATAFLESWTGAAQRESFIYLDPPYFVKGRGLYDNFYSADDHALVAKRVALLDHPWIVSYDAAPEILKLYKDWDSIRYSLSYSAATRGQGAEVMFFSPGLEKPDKSPSQVTVRDVTRLKQSLGELLG